MNAWASAFPCGEADALHLLNNWASDPIRVGGSQIANLALISRGAEGIESIRLGGRTQKGKLVNKAELIDSLAKAHFDGNKAVATRALNAVVDTISTEVARTGKVSITGFGVFEVIHREARVVRNPRTGERKQAEAMDLPRFRPGTDLKNRVEAASGKRK